MNVSRFYYIILLISIVNVTMGQSNLLINPFSNPFKKPAYDYPYTRDESFDIKIGVIGGSYLAGNFEITRSAWLFKETSFLGHPKTESYRSSYGLGMEYYRVKSFQTICPKISYSMSTGIFHIGLNIIYATNYSIGAFYTRPQIGFSILKRLELGYGYNIPISNNTMKGMLNTHVFFLMGYISPYYRRAPFK